MKLLNLYSLRVTSGFSQKEVAQRIEVSKQQYSRIENGQQNGSIVVWKKLSNLFNKPIDYLLEQAVDSPNLTDKG